jgi:hypothetical protein
MGSLGADVFLESQENGLVNFRAGAGAGRFEDAAGAGGACGGGDHGTEGRAPESPCNELFEDLGGRIGFDARPDC